MKDGKDKIPNFCMCNSAKCKIFMEQNIDFIPWLQECSMICLKDVLKSFETHTIMPTYGHLLQNLCNWYIYNVCFF